MINKVAGNIAPNPPSNPFPAIGSKYNSEELILLWYFTDPDNDVLIYTIYFSESNPPAATIATDLKNPEFEVTNLEQNKKYYCRVEAKDIYGATTIGDDWSFKIIGTTSLDENLIAYWNFDDDTALDHSGHGMNGQFKGSFQIVNGKKGNEVRVLGTTTDDDKGGHVLLPTINFSSYSKFTIVLWVNEKSIAQPWGESYIYFGSSTSGWLGISHAGDYIDSTLYLSFAVGSTSKNDRLKINFNYNDRNKWIFYSLIYKNGTIYAYRNGKVVDSLRQDVYIQGDDGAIARHWWYNGTVTSTRFIGAIDEVEIFNYALTDDEIKKKIEPNSCDETEFDYKIFDKIDDFKLVNNSKHIDSFIRLTEARTHEKGALWYKKKVPVKNGFTTSFSFRMSDGKNDFEDGSIPGADGFAFVIQNTKDDIIGRSGGGIGYEGIPNSIAIEIDTYCNNLPGDNINDPNGNHVALQTMGKYNNLPGHDTTATLGINDKIFQLKTDGTVYYCKIDYNATGGNLKVYLDTLPEFKNLVLEINSIYIAKLLELDAGCTVYVGITSATGTSVEKHDLLSWSMCPYPCQPVISNQKDEFSIFNSKFSIKVIPNPFASSTQFEYNIAAPSAVTLVIYDMYGVEIAELVNELQASGRHIYNWQPQGIASGLYYYILITGDTKNFGKLYYMRE